MGVYKKILSVFFNYFCLVYIKMVDIMDVYKSLDISIGTVMKNPETTIFAPDHLKTKKNV